MRVRISYLIEVDDRYRRALRHYKGREGLATRAEIKERFRQNGDTMDNDILFYLDKDEPEDKTREGTRDE